MLAGACAFAVDACATSAHMVDNSRDGSDIGDRGLAVVAWRSSPSTNITDLLNPITVLVIDSAGAPSGA
jgi:hypothetical protein